MSMTVARRAASIAAPMAKAGSSRAPRSIQAAMTASDQLLVGLNRTRRAYNRRMRELFGYSSEFPEPGDKLVCLGTTARRAAQWRRLDCQDDRATRKKKLILNVVPKDEPLRKPCGSACCRSSSTAPTRTHATGPARLRRIRFRLCAHRPQGARLAMEQRLAFDESFAFREHRNRGSIPAWPRRRKADGRHMMRLPLTRRGCSRIRPSRRRSGPALGAEPIVVGSKLDLEGGADRGDDVARARAARAFPQ